MNTSQTKQRPTPETEASKLELCQKSKIDSTLPNNWNWVVEADFARKLERQRDEAREELENILDTIPADAPCLHAETGETVADYILDLQKEVGKVHALYFNDKQQLEAMREATKVAYEALDAADGSSYHIRGDACLTHQAREQRAAAIAKLQPFLK